jgi:hypothetical protein
VPELDVGSDDDALRLLDPVLVDVLDPVLADELDPVLELLCLLVVLELAEEPELLADVVDVCADPGSVRATTPPAARLAKPAAAVVTRSRLRPRSRSATARATACRCWFSMLCSLAARCPASLHAPSAWPMSPRA